MEKITENKSLLLEFFGDAPQFKVIDFLLENRLRDFTKTEIARGSSISWATLFNHWDNLEEHGIVKLTRTVGRAKLYQLNESEPIVKQIKTIEMRLIKQAADAEEDEASMKVKAKCKKA